MTNHWFFADPHFGHANIIKYTSRTDFMSPSEIDQFNAHGDRCDISQESAWEMNDVLIDNINQHVNRQDILWFLGDWCFAPRKFYHKDSHRCRDRINCNTIHAIWGNHDQPSIIKDLFSSSNTQVMIAIDRNTGEYHIGEETIKKDPTAKRWQKIILSHTLMAIWIDNHKGAWHLYGHSHSGAESWADTTMPGRRSIDVGIDNAKKILGSYRPFSYPELNTIFKDRDGFTIDHHK